MILYPIVFSVDIKKRFADIDIQNRFKKENLTKSFLITNYKEIQKN